MITTITPYWKRPETLRVWLAAMAGATRPWLRHIVYFVGEPAPAGARDYLNHFENFKFIEMVDHAPGDKSIGHYHNLGALEADTEWIMKLDVDTIPSVDFFPKLAELLLVSATPREWFNVGMMYTTQAVTLNRLGANHMPVLEGEYAFLTNNWGTCSVSRTVMPAATNFVCRQSDYLDLGGCDERFRGYGWEDYHQIYMLERHFQNREPLPGPITIQNVTHRCRDEISRRKARELWNAHKLCLLHRWHAPSTDHRYRSAIKMGQNRKVLLERITNYESKPKKLTTAH